MPRGEPAAPIHPPRKRNPARHDQPIPGTSLLIKRLDKNKAGNPYCVEPHPVSTVGLGPKKAAELKASGRTSPKVAEVILSVAGYPVPMCKRHADEFIKVYKSSLEAGPRQSPSEHTLPPSADPVEGSSPDTRPSSE